jgi:protein-export membrane protein SecD
MGRRHTITLAVIGILLIFSVAVLAIHEIGSRQGMSLGLDLQGGTHLVYEADFTEVQPGAEGDAIAVARQIIEKRINRYGVSEPSIQIIGDDRISVQIPGVSSEEAKALVGAVAELEFREQKGTYPNYVYAALVSDVAVGATNITVTNASGFDVGDTCVLGALGQVEGIEPNRDTKEITAINQTANILFLDSALFYDHQLGEPVGAWIAATGVIDEGEVTLTGQYLLPNSYVDVQQQTGQPVVAFEWDETGARLFAQITGRLAPQAANNNQGQQLGIFLDNDLISAPAVQSEISAKGIIEGLSIDEARILASQLNGGALPLPLGHWDGDEFYPGEPAVIQSVDATLGADSLQKSLIAGIIGLVLVLLFMIAYYRLPGALACIALLIYGAIVLMIFKLVPVTLTLAHIAAFILSIGMAVDANVLIFERMKEEMRSGKTVGAAVEAGFNRAWPAIRDSNVSTLITCIILFWFGSRIVAAPLVMGFALTLGIGVTVSMLTAIVVTRSFLRTIVFTPLSKQESLFKK